MSALTLYDKVWDRHCVTELPSGLSQILIGLHLIHEVTSPQAFAMLREDHEAIAYPNRTFATIDHIIPTHQITRPFSDSQAEKMAATLEKNIKDFNIQFFGPQSGQQGIVHVIGPEMGLTHPGMTIACGDSHTSTHGAFGALAFGIGTTEVRQIFSTQTMALSRLNVRKIVINGTLSPGVYAKDVILRVIADLGVNGGLGYAYEYSGSVIDAMTMEERMTICNMSIEGGARIGYINPDQTTFDYLYGKPYAPTGSDFDSALVYWNSIRSEPDAVYDDIYEIDGGSISPMITWGINPGQAIGISECLPDPNLASDSEKTLIKAALDHMKLAPNISIIGTPIDVAFIGSCTNGRISDLREAAAIFKGNHVAPDVTCLVVPGSQKVKKMAEADGLDVIFTEAGAEWREAGCSMCLAMNTDRLKGDQMCASSSNRNFIGRQGSPTGRTLLMSPAMVASAAIHGVVSDVRKDLR